MNTIKNALSIVLFALFPYILVAQDAYYRNVYVEDTITAAERGDDLFLVGKEGAVVVDTLKVGSMNIVNDGQVHLRAPSNYTPGGRGSRALRYISLLDYVRRMGNSGFLITGNFHEPRLVISAGTHPGFDNRSIIITPAGGTDDSDTRGPSISMYANEYNVRSSLKGSVVYKAGNASYGDRGHTFFTKAYRRLYIEKEGDIRATAITYGA